MSLKGKVYTALLSKHSKIKNKRFEKQLRSSLKNDNFSIICSNCIGGIIYSRLGKKFLSPTINLWINQKDFLKLIQNLKSYMDKELVFVDDEKYDYPVGLLGDIKIYFNHSENEDNAKADWEKRRTRINYDNLYIIMYDRDGITIDDIHLLKDVDCKNIIILTDKEYPNIDYAKTINPNLNAEFGYQFLDIDKYEIRTFEKQWDFVDWLNSDKTNTNR